MPQTEGTASPGAPICPNCGSPHLRRYCPECGQSAPRPTDYSLGAYARELLDQLTSTEGKGGRTAWALVARPGLLTADHLAGRRARYLRPLQLFLVFNVLLFVAAPTSPMFSYSLEKYLRSAPPSPALVERMVAGATPGGHTHDPARGGRAFEAYAAAFDARVEVQRKSLVVLFAPALAGVLWVLCARRRHAPGVPRRYGEHLVFALHVLAFGWLVLAAMGVVEVLARFAVQAGAGTAGVVAAVVLLLMAAPAYVLLAVRRVYRLGWPAAVGATALVAAAFMGLVLVYRGLLFFTTYWSL